MLAGLQVSLSFRRKHSKKNLALSLYTSAVIQFCSWKPIYNFDLSPPTVHIVNRFQRPRFCWKFKVHIIVLRSFLLTTLMWFCFESETIFSSLEDYAHSVFICTRKNLGTSWSNECFNIFRMVSCLLKHLRRKIESNVVRRFDVSNIIIKNEENDWDFNYSNSILLLTPTLNVFSILDNDVWYIETSNSVTFNFSS